MAINTYVAIGYTSLTGEAADYTIAHNTGNGAQSIGLVGQEGNLTEAGVDFTYGIARAFLAFDTSSVTGIVTHVELCMSPSTTGVFHYISYDPWVPYAFTPANIFVYEYGWESEVVYEYGQAYAPTTASYSAVLTGSTNAVLWHTNMGLEIGTTYSCILRNNYINKSGFTKYVLRSSDDLAAVAPADQTQSTVNLALEFPYPALVITTVEYLPPPASPASPPTPYITEPVSFPAPPAPTSLPPPPPPPTLALPDPDPDPDVEMVYSTATIDTLYRKYLSAITYTNASAKQSAGSVGANILPSTFLVDSDCYIWRAAISIPEDSGETLVVEYGTPPATGISVRRATSEYEFFTCSDPVWYPASFLETSYVPDDELKYFLYMRNLETSLVTVTVPATGLTPVLSLDAAMYMDSPMWVELPERLASTVPSQFRWTRVPASAISTVSESSSGWILDVGELVEGSSITAFGDITIVISLQYVDGAWVGYIDWGTASQEGPAETPPTSAGWAETVLRLIDQYMIGAATITRVGSRLFILPNSENAFPLTSFEASGSTYTVSPLDTSGYYITMFDAGDINVRYKNRSIIEELCSTGVAVFGVLRSKIQRLVLPNALDSAAQLFDIHRIVDVDVGYVEPNSLLLARVEAAGKLPYGDNKLPMVYYVANQLGLVGTTTWSITGQSIGSASETLNIESLYGDVQDMYIIDMSEFDYIEESFSSDESYTNFYPSRRIDTDSSYNIYIGGRLTQLASISPTGALCVVTFTSPPSGMVSAKYMARNYTISRGATGNITQISTTVDNVSGGDYLVLLLRQITAGTAGGSYYFTSLLDADGHPTHYLLDLARYTKASNPIVSGISVWGPSSTWVEDENLGPVSFIPLALV